jgi:hypothetical protein
MVVKRKIHSPLWELDPRTLIVQPVAQCYIDKGILIVVMMISLYKLLCCCGGSGILSLVTVMKFMEDSVER